MWMWIGRQVSMLLSQRRSCLHEVRIARGLRGRIRYRAGGIRIGSSVCDWRIVACRNTAFRVVTTVKRRVALICWIWRHRVMPRCIGKVYGVRTRRYAFRTGASPAFGLEDSDNGGLACSVRSIDHRLHNPASSIDEPFKQNRWIVTNVVQLPKQIIRANNKRSNRPS